MKWFNNLKLGGKLITAFVVVALLAGLVGIIGIYNIKSIDGIYSNLYELYGASLGDIGEVAVSYQRIRVNIRDIVLDKNAANKQKYIDGINQLDKNMAESLAKFQKTLTTEEGKRLSAKLTDELNRYNPIRNQILALAANGQEDQAAAMMNGEGRQLAVDINDTIDKMVELKIKTGRTQSDVTSSDVMRIIYVLAAIVIIAVMSAFGLGLFIAKLISRPVNELVSAAEKITAGDLNVKIEATGKDEIGMLANSFRKMTENLNEVMLNIHSAAEQVASGSKQVSDSSMALSQGATEQASSIEELTASIEEISSQTKLNADGANKANELAESAKGNAVTGNNQMQEMLKAMSEINESSGNISKIIKVIDEIAFQTNILALNAAVEAARAGQHGKGFAVVAEEVRNLAARSASAAKETTVMIEGSIKKVEHGTTIANETAAALNCIVDGVAEVATLVGNIAVACTEQAAGIAQINQGIMQVSQVVQNNSATSEESAAASEELSGQAEILRDMVSRFQLRKGSYSSSLNGLPPDVLKVLEGKKTANTEIRPIAAAAARSIDLGDRDFGKY